MTEHGADGPWEGIVGLEHLDEIVELAAAAAATREPGKFYQALRASEVPYLLKHHEGDPRGLFRATIAASHRIGESSPALALAVSQHLASMWAFGLGRALIESRAEIAEVVHRLLTETFRDRLLIANTTSQVGGKQIGGFGSTLRESDGRLFVEGSSTYMSLATEADKITFITRMPSGELVAVVGDLRDDASIVVDDELLFGDHLALADTRRVRFDRVAADPDRLIGPDQRLMEFYSLQLAAQTLCVAALYLGSAYDMLRATRRFGWETTLPDGEALARSGAFVSDLGRLVLDYRNSLRLILSMSPTVEATSGSEPGSGAAGRLLDEANAVKYAVARHVEDIATGCRKLLGARSFMNDHPVGRLGSEIVFAALGPGTEKSIERTVGARFLES